MLEWLQQKVKTIDESSSVAARNHQANLTKPLGSLGRLEVIAEKFAGWQSTKLPSLEHISVVVFAGDHGVCQQQVSAFPQEVTAQMIINFLQGGAAINVLSEQLNAGFSVCNVGTVSDLPEVLSTHPRLHQSLVARGTADFSQQPAMTASEMFAAINCGKNIADALVAKNTQLFVGGEMGIGNTTSASALYAALLSLTPEAVVGAGAGVDESGIQRKQAVIAKALALHQLDKQKPLDILRCLGGLEIAALVGCYIRCAQQGIPVMVDGFICTAAALVAIRINPEVQQWFLFSHQSAEFAHHTALQALGEKPLLDLGLRLGEGSGAALAVPIVQSALQLHQHMATFTQAGVSTNE